MVILEKARRYEKTLMWALVIFWMGLIFFFSAQEGEESAKLSDGITQQVVEAVVEDFEELPEKQQIEIMDKTSFLVRKAAHFTEYFILGILIWRLLGCYGIFGRRAVLFAWIAGTVYAVTDELHQIFSDGRSPQAGDVCIDSSGVLLGILVICGLAALARRRKARAFACADREERNIEQKREKRR